MSIFTTAFGGAGQTRPATDGVGLVSGIRKVISELQHRAVMRNTNRVLGNLSDRELKDIGLTRGDLPLTAVSMRKRYQKNSLGRIGY